MNKYIVEIHGSNEVCSWVHHYSFLCESKEKLTSLFKEALDDMILKDYNYTSRLDVLGKQINFLDLCYYSTRFNKNAYDMPTIFSLDEWFDYIYSNGTGLK